MTAHLKVGTINLLIDRSRWEERLPLLVTGLAAEDLDLIAVQEVADPLGVSHAHQLADRLGGYEVIVAPKTGRGGRHEGIAVLSRLPVERHETLDLGSQRRVALLARVDVGGSPCLFVNGHFQFPAGLDRARLRQVDRLFARLDAIDRMPLVVCGDFNATPGSRTVARMKTRFVSAHESAHGCEPEFTCPTLLASGGRARRAVGSGLLAVLSRVPRPWWRWTLDYIFVGGDLRVEDCRLILDRPSAGDPTLYASDHVGLVAALRIAGDGGPNPV